MPRMKKNSLTPLQERLLLAIYSAVTAESYRYMNSDGREGGYTVFVGEKGLARLMGGKMSAYRIKTLQDLVDSGWLNCKLLLGKRAYSLSPVGYQTLDKMYALRNYEYEVIFHSEVKS